MVSGGFLLGTPTKMSPSSATKSGTSCWASLDLFMPVSAFSNCSASGVSGLLWRELPMILITERMLRSPKSYWGCAENCCLQSR